MRDEKTTPDSAMAAAKAGRWTKAAIEDRRRRVFDFVVVRKLSETSVASMLGVHRNTVVSDVRMLRSEMARAIQTLDVRAEIGGFVARYDKIAADAILEADATKTAGSKAFLLSQALRAMELKQRLLIETGYLPNAIRKVEGRLEVSGGLDIRSMSTAELREYRSGLLQQLQRTGLS